MVSPPPVLSMRGITKKFGAMVALDSVDFDVVPGEIHAIVGENGAGKSTLMNCLFGLLTADSGDIIIDGEPSKVTGPRDALTQGIGMVHQHFKLVPSLTVTENIYLGREIPRALGFVDTNRQRARVLELSKQFGLDIDPDARIRDLSVGAQQRVEILRSLLTDAKILILDEPTAVLTPQETEGLFSTLRGIVDDGLGVVFISHHLKEVKAIADRVTVLRHGKRVAHDRVDNVDEHQLAEWIVGEELSREEAVYPPGTPEQDVLVVRGLSVMTNRGVESAAPVDFTVRAGEVVGVVGIPGNGQSELVEAITGLRRPTAGTVAINGTTLARQSPAAARRAGMAHIPEDRNSRGISLFSSVSENITLGYLDDSRIGRFFLRRRAITDLVNDLVARYNVRVANSRVLAKRLSGGNAQKVVIARELSRAPAVIVACEPVRGLDIAATRFVHSQLISHRDRGAAVLLVSTELSNVMDLSDRLLVINGGRIVGEFVGDFPSELEISKLMLGMGA